MVVKDAKDIAECTGLLKQSSMFHACSPATLNKVRSSLRVERVIAVRVSVDTPSEGLMHTGGVTKR